MTARQKRADVNKNGDSGGSKRLRERALGEETEATSEQRRDSVHLNEDQLQQPTAVTSSSASLSLSSSSSSSSSISSPSPLRQGIFVEKAETRRHFLSSFSQSNPASPPSSSSSSSSLSASSVPSEDEGETYEVGHNDLKPKLDLLQEGDPGTLTGVPIRLYADGVFDLFHFGHTKALEQAKKLYPHTYLMVGCCSDATTHRYKGITVLSEEERYESLRHCRWVDEVIEDAPWVAHKDFLVEHNIDYVCHDALPYADTSGEAEDGDVYLHLKRMGKFLETQRTEGISTSDIINRSK